MSKMQRYIDENGAANGLAVIFTNNYEDPPAFNYKTGRKLSALEECHQDGNEMEKTFSTFGFACLRKENYSAAEIRSAIIEMRDCVYPPISNYKCLAVVFSGHGEESVVLGSDGKPVSIEDDLIGPLQPTELHEMRRVPKLFFIDACRGDLKMTPAVKSKGNGPELGGYFVAYSTTMGYKAYTHGETSKWMPRVAERLRSLDESVQNIVAEITEEMRNDPHDMQCPEYTGSCQPVYLHRLYLLQNYDETDGGAVPDTHLLSKPKSSSYSAVPNDELDSSNLVFFLEAINDIVDWQNLGLKFGLKKRPTLQRIALECANDIGRCKIEMLQAWFDWVDNVEEFGRPSWKRLIDAVRKVDKPVAEDIEKKAPWNKN